MSGLGVFEMTRKRVRDALAGRSLTEPCPYCDGPRPHPLAADGVS
jgi:Ribonuclease G/E